MLKIRLRRTGSRLQPSYRVVVADSRSARDGSFVDYLGHYNPRTDPPTVEIDYEKAQRIWLKVKSTKYSMILYEDVIPALQLLKQRGLVIGLISNIGHTIYNLCKTLVIDEYLEFIINDIRT